MGNVGKWVEATGRAGMLPTMINLYNAERDRALEEKRMNIYGGIAQSQEARAQERYEQERAIAPELQATERQRLRTERLKLQAEEDAARMQQQFLNSRTDYRANPMYQSFSPGQQQWADKTLKSMGVVDANGTVTNRDLMQALHTLETTGKMFTEFTNIGIQERRNSIAAMYEQLNKAKESGNQKKVAEITAQIEDSRKVLDSIINTKSRHEERLEVFERLSPEMKDFIMFKYGSLARWNPDNVQLEKDDYLEFVSARTGAKGRTPGGAEKGTLTEAQVLQQIDAFTTMHMDPTQKETVYNYYRQLRTDEPGLTREEALSRTFRAFGEAAPATVSTGKEDMGKGLWK